MRPRDPGAAQTGVTETTKEPHMYTFWPGKAGVFHKVFEQITRMLRFTSSPDLPAAAKLQSAATAEMIRALAKHKEAWSYLDHRDEGLQPGDRVLLEGAVEQEECVAEVVSVRNRKIRVRLENGEVNPVSSDSILGVIAECIIWDLPGVGTPNFPQQTYLKKMGVRHFDLVVLMTASRFTEAELMLVEELQRWGVPYFLVRSKTDVDVKSEIEELEAYCESPDGELEEGEKREVEIDTLSRIREFFMHEHHLGNVYCVSSRPRYRTRFDFLRLEHDMEEALRRQRRVRSEELR
jgi:hypothetical protein